jgi:pimeloyl-ACP methyl ester carboxylesterase
MKQSSVTREHVVATSATVSLEEALRRFEQEAIRGVCATDRYRCSYFSWGTGPPLVFLHGLGDLAYSFVPVISVLASDFQCIAYDQPAGHGDAARLAGYSHADLVSDLFSLLDHLGLQQSSVFGSSFGSTIALAAMRSRPERVSSAILAGGFAQRALAPAERLLAGVGRFLPGKTRLMPFRQAIGKSCLGPFAVRRPEFLEFFVRNSGCSPLAALAHRAWMMHRLDLRGLLADIQQPVLLVCGDCDPLVGRNCEEVLLEGLPRAARVELADCAHMPHYTHPEVLSELIRRFLTAPAACGGGDAARAVS